MENASVSESARGHIEVFQYLGYNGGFAHKRTLLWLCRVVGVNGKPFPDATNWKGCADPIYAESHAKDWESLTGWPVVNLGRHPEYDHGLRE